MLSKQLLKDFSDDTLKTALSYNETSFYSKSLIKQFKNDCMNIISLFEKIFPAECAQLYQLIVLLEEKAIKKNICLRAINELVKYMYDKFEQTYKSPKLFISHATLDKEIVESFVTLLELIGVNPHQLFCSSINTYGIPQGAGNIYNYIQSEMSNDNLFVIMMLSKNYYDSYMCLNEMGAAWIKKAEYQSILLPGFDFPDIKGAIDPRDICFKLDDQENRNYSLNALKDRIIEHLELSFSNTSLWERHRDKFIMKIDKIIRTTKSI